jgi:hypothetical protein
MWYHITWSWQHIYRYIHTCRFIHIDLYISPVSPRAGSRCVHGALSIDQQTMAQLRSADHGSELCASHDSNRADEWGQPHGKSSWSTPGETHPEYPISTAAISWHPAPKIDSQDAWPSLLYLRRGQSSHWAHWRTLGMVMRQVRDGTEGISVRPMAPLWPEFTIRHWQCGFLAPESCEWLVCPLTLEH